MKSVRLLFWLVLLPTVLLVVGYRLAAVLAERPTPAPSRSSPQSGSDPATDADPAAAASAAADRARHEQARQSLARDCLASADRATGNALRDADPLLVIVARDGCGEGCDTDAIASSLADEWRFYCLKVLLLRTREGGPAASPLGVTTLVMPQCAALVDDGGDDYFLRRRDGSLSSGGEIFARRTQGAKPDAAPFEPAALVRAHYAKR